MICQQECVGNACLGGQLDASEIFEYLVNE